MERREWIRWLTASGVASALGALDERSLLDLGAQVHAAARGFRVLTEAEARTVSVIAELILPRTDTPGATDANVTAFIDHLLAHWYSVAERDAFVQGLAEMEGRAQAAHGAGFLVLAPARQLALLEAVDGEITALRRRNAAAANAHWFGTLKSLTVFGYCTSEVGMTRHLRTWPLPGRYDGNAPVGG